MLIMYVILPVESKFDVHFSCPELENLIDLKKTEIFQIIEGFWKFWIRLTKLDNGFPGF